MIKIGTTGIADVKVGSAQIGKVCAGNNVVWQKARGLFCAIGIDIFGSYPNIFACATSRNGTSWTSGLQEMCDCNDIAYGAGKFVAVGDYGVYAVSTDGMNWTAGTISSSPTLEAITYADGKFVAVGNRGVYVGNQGVYAVSTDGTNWTAGNVSAADGRFTSIAFTNSISFGPNKGFYALLGVTNDIVNSCKYAFSADGTSWNVGTVSYQFKPTGIASGNGILLAVSSEYGVCAKTSDGTSWTKITIDDSAVLNAIAYADGKFVAVGNNGAIYLSQNGESWNKVSSGITLNLTAVTYGTGRFVAVAGNGDYAVSTDGTNWTTGTVEADVSFRSIAFKGG